MSLIGTVSNALLNYYAPGIQPRSQQNNQTFQQIEQGFQKLGSDLNAGNLTAAQSDIAALQPFMPQSTANVSTSATSGGTVSQAFSKLSGDVQSGNLTAAQQDYATLQQDIENQHMRHHHHHSGGSSGSNANMSTSVSQIMQQLGQQLQAGNLSAAQAAYATLQQDLQQYAINGGALSALQTGSLSLTA